MPTAPGSSVGEGFRLTKWYFDCADPGGRVAIGYQVSLAWQGLRVGWQEITLYNPGGPVSHRSRAGAPADVEMGSGRIQWPAPRLGGDFTIVPLQPGAADRLAATDAGTIDWRCEAPAARVSARLDGATIDGVGYAECLTMSMPPWRTGIRELRWGRWMTDDGARSVVWIDWRGRQDKTWVYVDSIPQHGAAVTDAIVSAGPSVLTLGEPTTLIDRDLGRIVSTIPGLATLLPQSILAVRDVKWRSRACLSEPAGTAGGTAIYERIILP